MPASYPSSIKSFTTKQDNVDDVLAAHINDLQDEVVAIETELGVNAKQRMIKGWISLNGTGTIAINDSHNVTSITDNGVGDYTITWDTDFANANYAWAYGATEQSGPVPGIAYQVSKAAGSLRVNIHDNNSNGDYDPTDFCLMAIGDQ